MQIAPGATVGGKYVLERPLARGGMGAVWVARHQKLGSSVAVKFLDAHLAASSTIVARFEREARAAATLDTPHVVHVHDYGVEQGTPYLVMELLRGEDLSTRLRTRGRLSLAEAGRILVQMSRALRRAHEAGIVHRDLKPANVFLARLEEDEEIVKILDFGIAKEAWSRADESTKTGEVFGSPHYMSPEQARAEKTVDHRADIWAVGVIAYRMLTGKLPFPGQAVGEVLSHVLVDPFPPLAQAAPDLPPALSGFFSRALAKKPQDRFASIGELIESFRTILGEATGRQSLSEIHAALRTLDPSAPVMPITGPQPPAAPSPPGPTRPSATNTSAPTAVVVPRSAPTKPAPPAATPARHSAPAAPLAKPTAPVAAPAKAAPPAVSSAKPLPPGAAPKVPAAPAKPSPPPAVAPKEPAPPSSASSLAAGTPLKLSPAVIVPSAPVAALPRPVPAADVPAAPAAMPPKPAPAVPPVAAPTVPPEPAPAALAPAAAASSASSVPVATPKPSPLFPRADVARKTDSTAPTALFIRPDAPTAPLPPVPPPPSLDVQSATEKTGPSLASATSSVLPQQPLQPRSRRLIGALIAGALAAAAVVLWAITRPAAEPTDLAAQPSPPSTATASPADSPPAATEFPRPTDAPAPAPTAETPVVGTQPVASPAPTASARAVSTTQVTAPVKTPEKKPTGKPKSGAAQAKKIPKLGI